MHVMLLHQMREASIGFPRAHCISWPIRLLPSHRGERMRPQTGAKDLPCSIAIYSYF